MTNDIVNGVQTIEFGLSNGDGTTPDEIVVFDNIEDGSVSYTSNKDTSTSITPEDKDVPILVLYTPGDADTFNFALLELSPQNLKALFNVIYDPATSKFTVLAQKAHANLWIRLTTRAQLGAKKIFVFPNTLCDVAYKNNFTKNALVSIAVTASILSYTDENGNVCAYTIQKVNADGSNIDDGADETTPLDTIQSFATATAATSEGITTTLPATSASAHFAFDKIDAPQGAPVNMVLKLAGSTVATVSFPADYTGGEFQFTDTTGTVHTGVFAAGNVALT